MPPKFDGNAKRTLLRTELFIAVQFEWATLWMVLFFFFRFYLFFHVLQSDNSICWTIETRGHGVGGF